MTVILIVEKSGNIKETNVKNVQVSDLYKKAGFKTDEGFTEPMISWPRPGIDPFTLDYQIQVFGKTKGRAGQENKYDFPPPIDTTLFFGNVVLVAVRPGGVVVDLTMTAWEMVYDQLFGGFEDLVDSQGRSLDSEEDEEDDDDGNIEGYEYTKEGYVKDDFIVDDDEIEEEDNKKEDKVFRKNMLLDSDEESEFELPKSRKNKKKTIEKKPKKSKVLEVMIPEPESEPEPVIEPQEESEEDIKPTKKQRKPRVIKEPKEPKVKKEKVPKEPKEKSEPKKKTKRSGKKNMDEDNSETAYMPLDTIELEEETYV